MALKKSGIRKYVLLSTILLAGCQADQGSKYWAVTQLKGQEAVRIVPNLFELSYVENAGVAFGLLDQIDDSLRIPLIIILPLLATGVIAFILWRWRNRQLRMLLPLILVLSGAIGNILDRVNYGYVIDFFYLHYHYRYSFPVFNVADMLVFAGGIWFMYLLWKDETPLSLLREADVMS
ncbi:MAG: signal peptidase II [Bacteroidetes bacterium]|nr:MAG: signal peptidase II [Bacteroidota bacterium]